MLLIYTENIGAPTQTFIKRHLEELYPNQTCLISERLAPPSSLSWDFKGPKCILSEDIKDTSIGILKRSLANKLGIHFNDSFYFIKKFIATQNPTAALFEFIGTGIENFQLIANCGIPTFVHAYGFDVYQRLKEPELKKKYLTTYHNAKGIFAMSEHMKSTLIEHGFSREKIHVVPCGVNLPKTSPKENSKDPKSSRTFKFMSAGRMVSKKSPILLLESFRLAKKSAPDLHLNYFGDGPLKAAVIDYISAHKLADSVTLHGSISHQQLLQEYQRHDGFIQHSKQCPLTGDSEGIPVAILEAMSHKLPIISTRHAGIPEVIDHEKNGLLVDEGNCEGMAQAILQLVNSRKLAHSIGKHALTTISEKFTAEYETKTLRTFLNA